MTHLPDMMDCAAAGCEECAQKIWDESKAYFEAHPEEEALVNLAWMETWEWIQKNT